MLGMPFGALALWDGHLPSAGTDGNLLRSLRGQSLSGRQQVFLYPVGRFLPTLVSTVSRILLQYQIRQSDPANKAAL